MRLLTLSWRNVKLPKSNFDCFETVLIQNVLLISDSKYYLMVGKASIRIISYNEPSCLKKCISCMVALMNIGLSSCVPISSLVREGTFLKRDMGLGHIWLGHHSNV